MTNLSKTIAFLSLLLIVLKVKAKKSCISTCSESSFPHCGSWIAYDNAKDAAGVYLRNFGFVNLTCSVNSLPKPVTIKWMFRANGASTAQETTCASVRTVTECKFNDVGEHKVLSTCMVNVTQLEQAGDYCTNSNIKHFEILIIFLPNFMR